jgi:hypothetical protein
MSISRFEISEGAFFASTSFLLRWFPDTMPWFSPYHRPAEPGMKSMWNEG